MLDSSRHLLTTGLQAQVNSIPSAAKNSFGDLFSCFIPRCHACSSASARVRCWEGVKSISFSVS